MRIKIIGISLIIIILAAFAVVARFRYGKERNASMLDQGVGFTLRATGTTYNPDGSVFGVSNDVRYESSNGTYRHVSVGAVTREYSHQVGRGFFMVDHKRQLLLKSPIVGPHRNTFIGASPEALRASPKFVRTEQLLGYTAYVLQFKDRDTGVMFEEGWTIPELGTGFVKFIDYDRVSGKLVETFEPISIVVAEPYPADLRLPDYPEKLSPAPKLPR